MENKITEEAQRITIYKIDPNEQDLNGEVNFDRNVQGRNVYGNFYICNNVLIVKDEQNIVTGIFSLDKFYFLKVN